MHLLIIGNCLHKTLAHFLRKMSWVILPHAAQLLALRVVHIAQVVEGAPLAQLVPQCAGDLQVSLAALYRLRKLPHHF